MHSRHLSLRGLTILATLLLLFGSSQCSQAALRGELIQKSVANIYGLERAWFTQVRLDISRSKVENWILARDQFFVLTDIGIIQALDVATGETLWVAQVGNPNYPSLGPSVDAERLAVVNGATLYVLNRRTGRVSFERSLDGAPGAAPVLSGNHVYVPLIHGRVVGYTLDGSAPFPWFYQSAGRALVTPIATPNGLFWSTNNGDLYSAGGETPTIHYRVETRSPFATGGKYVDEIVYAVSEVGDLFAVDESFGFQLWKFSTGYPVYHPPAVIGNRIYLTSAQPALYSVDRETGYAQWTARSIRQFAAASDNYLYAMDRTGALTTLDARSGATISRINTGGGLMTVVNDQSDRILLISQTGLVQCLHEIGKPQPTYYVDEPITAETPSEESAIVAPIEADTPPAVEQDPLKGAEEPPLEEDPFGAQEDDPFGGFGDTPEEDDPFGAF